MELAVADVDDPVFLTLDPRCLLKFWPKSKFFHRTASVTDAAVVGLKKYIDVGSNISLQFHILPNTLPLCPSDLLVQRTPKLWPRNKTELDKEVKPMRLESTDESCEVGFAILAFFVVTGSCPFDSLGKRRGSTLEFSITPEVPKAPFAVAKALESLVCGYFACPVLSCPVLSFPVLSCPVLSCPLLSCPALSCPVLSCPVLSMVFVDNQQKKYCA